jgi:hypothetical protein
MPDLKISQLPVATTPLAGTELVPLVQGGVTVQSTVEAILTGTVPSGTANGVLFLNGSKVVTSGSGLVFDASGNLGLGVTPSAWSSSWSALQIGVSAAMWAFKGSNGLSGTYFANNNYFDGTNRVYINTAAATEYAQVTGLHIWYTAPSGTAGNTISFTQAMTLDASGNLGIGETSLTERITVRNDGTGAYSTIQLKNTNSTATLNVGVGGSAVSNTLLQNNAFIINAASSALVFGTADIERARITSGGDFQTSSGGSVQVGGTAARATTAGTNRVDIFDGTAPVGTLANGVSFYSASGEANVMDAAGNATLLSPHDTETNEWIFRSKHTPTGKVLRIDVERLLRFVNAHFGLDAVKEFV